MLFPQGATDVHILQIIPAPAQFHAKFGSLHEPVLDLPVVCLALVKRLEGTTLEGVVVDQGKLTLVSEINGFLGYHDGRSQNGSVNWFQRAEEYRQIQEQPNGQ
ncbi:MAG TPA: hypothetical protein VFV38_39950 [Ktedonobacteraceae bacterium]|nr:hypothetical protein [Ktedonobacteraceae bacterium]